MAPTLDGSYLAAARLQHLRAKRKSFLVNTPTAGFF